MRHGKKFKRLGLRHDRKVALIRNMVISLVEHEKVSTTVTRAKVVRPVIEKLITLGKNGTDALHTRRVLLSRLYNNDKAVDKILGVLAPRFKERPGGYTRIIRTGFRQGDNAETAILELV